jgi:HEAT repeat protein
MTRFQWRICVRKKPTPRTVLLAGWFIALCMGLLTQARSQTPPSLNALLKECIDRANAGDNAGTFNAVLNLAEALGKAPLTDIKDVLPDIMQAVDDKNPAVRTLALDSIVAIESRSNPDHTLHGDALPLLEPEIPRIAAHLTDDDTHIRSTTASVLGGFVIKPPDAVFAPLIAFLKRDDAVGPVGSSVVFDLVRLGPQHAGVANAVIAFLSRPDQTTECLVGSIDAVAHAQTHSEEIDTAVAHGLDIPKPAVRIAVIHDLPELQLPDDVFVATQTRLRQIAASDQEDPAVRAAANTILPCWVNDRHKACPAFTLPLPTPASPDLDDTSGQQ